VRKSVVGLVAPLVVVISAMFAPSAQATQCSFSYEQPFWSWNDASWYGLAPGASFENGGKAPPGWSLSKASVVKGGDPYRPWSNGYSLSLPSGSSATTPAFCVDSESPFSRMFAYTTTPNAKYTGGLRVDLIYTDATTKKVITKTVATLNQQSAWGPTAAFSLIDSAMKPRWDTSGRATVQYKFTPINSTAWRIDDLFIDPKKH